LKPLAIVTDFRALSFFEVSRSVAQVLKKNGVQTTIYDLTAKKIAEPNILCVGNIFNLPISYLQRFLPQQNVIFYAVTEGVPILDSMSHKLSEKITYITPSLYAKQCLEQAGLNCEAVIPHGIPLNEKYDKRFYDHVKQAIPQPSKVEPSNIMLCVSGNWQRKALDKLLIAYKTIEKITKDAFLILHSGIGNTNIVALQQMLELKRFWFTNAWGTLPSDKLASLYALCSFYVLPSMVEGFSLTFLEAFRWNKPVIGVDCPAGNEIVKDGYTGILIPVTKTEDIVWQQRHAIRLHYFELDSLIDAMLILTDEKTRNKMAENIKKEKYRWDQNVHYKKFLKYIE
jgi:glycosyltransferase involved in cell wall biosynthesis